jgi:hypothetical protein
MACSISTAFMNLLAVVALLRLSLLAYQQSELVVGYPLDLIFTMSTKGLAIH